MKILKVPESIAEFLGSEGMREEEIAQSAVIEWFREGRISSGKAAELLGMTLNEFIDLLGSKQIPIVTGTVRKPDELQKMLSKEKLK